MSTLGRRNTLLGYEQPISAQGFTSNVDDNETIKEQESYAPRRTSWSLNAEEIISSLNAHHSFITRQGRAFTSLPRFTDLGQYEITEADQFKLWSLETRRLVNIVNSDQPIELEGQSEWFGKANAEGYSRLGEIAIRLDKAVHMCLQDNEIILLKHGHSMGGWREVRRSKMRLFRYGASTSAGNAHQKEHEIDKYYHAIINYVTGILAQIFVRVAYGARWDTICIASLAKLSTKLKMLGLDLPRAAAISTGVVEKAEKEVKQSTAHPAVEYFVMGRFYQVMTRNLFMVTDNMNSPTSYGLDLANTYEISSILYDTGFRGLRSLLFQDRAGGMWASGNRKNTHCADVLFQVCLNTFEGLKRNINQRGAEPRGSTFVSWEWTQVPSLYEGTDPTCEESNVIGRILRMSIADFLPHTASLGSQATSRPEKPKVKSGRVALVRMQDIVTAIIPLSLLPGVSEISQMITIISFNTTIGRDVKMCGGIGFLAAFSIRSQESQAVPEGGDVTSVSASVLAKERALSVDDSNTTSFSFGAYNELVKANRKITWGLDTMEQWIIDQTAIVIPSRGYCYSSLGLGACLVIGGLAVGFTVEQRITGVDPFNISMFCWTLAAFLIVVLKSIRVETWPWRDFFHGRVVCRSVSEVCSVSGMDPQLLLSILLLLEPRMILEKRGPFNDLFEKKAAEGFSIDIPLSTRAVVQGGCYFVKVSTESGPALGHMVYWLNAWRRIAEICIRISSNLLVADYLVFSMTQHRDEILVQPH
ncbi:hypothetical protein M426DRAFT_28249 [Hypoxylon sp. CI-4A]|nr:hypothetical protein M426DRAFT_28249 [Hypoxylon sp. CI-4A]